MNTDLNGKEKSAWLIKTHFQGTSTEEISWTEKSESPRRGCG